MRIEFLVQDLHSAKPEISWILNTQGFVVQSPGLFLKKAQEKRRCSHPNPSKGGLGMFRRMVKCQIPFGKHTKNYGKSPYFNG